MSPSAQPSRVRVRTELHHATVEEIRARNEQWKANGVRGRASEDVPAAIRDASTAERATITQLRSWLLHPDERVVRAVLDNPAKPWQGTHEWFVRCALLLRAEQANLQEGITWNPTLDWIAEPGFQAEPQQVDRWNDTQEEPILTRAAWTYSAECQSRIRTHLAAAEDEPVAVQLLAFPNRTLSAVFAEAATISDAWIDAAAERPWFLWSALGNPRLRPEQARRMLDLAILRILSGGAGEDAWVYSHIVTAYDRKYGVPKDVRDRLLAAFQELRRNEGRIAAHRLEYTLTSLPRSPADELIQTYAPGDTSREAMIRLAGHPNASLELLRMLARDSGDFHLRSKLAGREDALADPEIAAELLKSSSAEIRQAFILKGSGEQLRHHLALALAKDKRMGEISSYLLLTWVHDRLEKIALDLTPDLVQQMDTLRADASGRRFPFGQGDEGSSRLPDIGGRYWALRLEAATAEGPPALEEAFVEMASYRPEGLVAALEEMSGEQIGLFSNSFLTRLLGHPNPEVREVVIRVVGRRADAPPLAAVPVAETKAPGQPGRGPSR
jgi:hypothetical protein